MSMSFWMNKGVRIVTNQVTLLVLILSSCCFDHDDVIWDSSKGESFSKQEEKMKHRIERRVGKIVDTNNRKPQALF